MKTPLLVVAALVWAASIGLAAYLTVERRHLASEAAAAYAAYRADSLARAARDSAYQVRVAKLLADSATLYGAMAHAQARARTAVATLRAALAELPDSTLAARADTALTDVAAASASCGLVLVNCEARARLEKLRADSVHAELHRADSTISKLVAAAPSPALRGLTAASCLAAGWAAAKESVAGALGTGAVCAVLVFHPKLKLPWPL